MSHLHSFAAGMLVATWASATGAAFADPPRLPPGVVVESVERGSSSDHAGIKVGDVLEAWSPPDGSGSRPHEITSPLLLADVEFGQLPRGPLILHGTRAAAPLRVEVAADAVGLGLILRPRFSPALLPLYRRGRDEIAKGRVKAGTALWEHAAGRAQQQAGEELAGCWLLAKAGTAWAVAQQPEAARDAYDRAAACAAAIDVRALAGVLGERTDQEFEMGAPQTALDAVQLALALRAEHPDTAALSGVGHLFDVAGIQGALGRSRDAVATLEALLALAETHAPESLLVARVLIQIGRRQELSGDIDAAQETQQRAADIAERVGRWSSTWARAQTALGSLAGSRGDLAGQDERWSAALEYNLRVAPGTMDAARSLINAGVVAFARGDLAACRHRSQAALDILDRLPTGRSIRGRALNNLGRAALLQGDAAEALRAFRRSAADIYATTPGASEVAVIELNLSEALAALGDLAGARLHAVKALTTAERLAPRSLELVAALIARGKLARRDGDWELAEKCFARGLDTMRDLDVEPIMATEVLQAMASALGHRGDAAGAERHLRQAVELFEGQRKGVGRSDEERSLFGSSFHGVYRDLVDLLAQRGRFGEAFQVLEASRARSLLAMLAARDLRFDLDVPPDKERERRAVGAAYEGARARLPGLLPGKDADTLQAKLAELRDRQAQLEAEIRRLSPRLATLREPEALDAAAIAGQLDAGTLLVAYSIGSDRTVAFVLEGGRDGVQGYVIPAGEDELARRVAVWRRLVQANPPGPRFQEEARHLYALLLGPLAEPLGRARRVVISADGPLHALPFAALRDERGFLVERIPVTFVPSGTVYAQQTMARGPRTWGAPFAFGDPRYAARTFAPLPGSRREVAGVAAAFPATREYLGAKATEETVKGLPRDARFVHFAVHGLVDVRAPLDSALAFSTPATGGGDNGLLHAWEIFERVRLDADLVALSACGSASGADRPGEGIIGLTRAFFYAGARSVLGSLWTVGDASTGPFMEAFYRAWSGGATKAEALRQAQVAAIHRGQRPLRWAGFQLYGDDR